MTSQLAPGQAVLGRHRPEKRRQRIWASPAQRASQLMCLPYSKKKVNVLAIPVGQPIPKSFGLFGARPRTEPIDLGTVASVMLFWIDRSVFVF